MAEINAIVETLHDYVYAELKERGIKKHAADERGGLLDMAATEHADKCMFALVRKLADLAEASTDKE